MPDFPRNLKLSQETESRLRSYLNTEIQNHLAERASWAEDLKNWQIDYWAEPAEEVKTIPFRGACNIVIPLTAIAIEAVHAREMTTLFALDQFITLKLPSQYSDLTSDTEKVLDKILLKDVDIYTFADNTLLENKKLGSAVGKVGYEKIIRRAIREQGGQDVPFDVIVKQGPCVDGVKLAAFMMPFTSQDPQTAPWCGEEHNKTPYNVKSLSESGFFYPEVMDRLQAYYSSSQFGGEASGNYDQEVQLLQNQTPIQWPALITWYEIWLSFDVDGNDIDEEIVVHYNYQCQEFLSVRYNWHDDLRRPYRINRYFPMEYRWAGIGIGKQNEQFQMEVTTQHRQRIDNATLANMRMYKAKDGKGISKNEPLFPGKIWLVEEMEDVEAFAMAEVYPSSYNNEQQAAIWSNQRTGVNELTLGMPQVGTPGTATGDLSRVQEANRKFDYTFKHSKRFLLDISGDVVLSVSQFGVRDSNMFQYIDNGEQIQQLLSLPPEELKLVILAEMSLAGQNSNKLIDRNTWTQLAGVTNQYYMGMMQIGQMMGPQVVQMIAQKAMIAATEVYKQILESYDVRSIDRITLGNLLGATNGLQIPGAGGTPLIGAADAQSPEGVGGGSKAY